MKYYKCIIFITCLILTTFITANAQSFSNVAPANGIYTGFGYGSFGGGVSFADFNGDGLDDLTFATASGSPLRFYQNNGNGFDPIFPLVTNVEEVKQVLWADYDNDGDKDLFIAVHNGVNRLYNNDGNMVLTDVSAFANIPGGTGPTYGASFGDYNKDGWLDLFIANRGGVVADIIYKNVLLLNNGDGTFTDVSDMSVVGDEDKQTFCGAFLDYNNDLWPDLYVIQDRYNAPNNLYRNDNGTFTDISTTSGAGVAINAMNAGVGDYDNDGDLDIYVTNTNQGNVLLRNDGNDAFSDVTNVANVGFFQYGWGGNFFDYDNDMDLDLYVSSDRNDSAEPNVLYENNGDGTFFKPIPTGFLGDTVKSTANAIGDFNEDGLLDIAVSNYLGTNFMVWENETASSDNWIKIALEGVESNRDGIGVWIEVSADEKVQYRYTLCGEAYLGQNTNNHHIGLGLATIADAIKIRWPSGNVDLLHDVAVNQKIKIREGQGMVAPQLQCSDELLIHEISDNTTYNARQVLRSDAVVPAGFNVSYFAGNSIELKPGFEIPVGTEFSAEIKDCP